MTQISLGLSSARTLKVRDRDPDQIFRNEDCPRRTDVPASDPTRDFGPPGTPFCFGISIRLEDAVDVAPGDRSPQFMRRD